MYLHRILDHVNQKFSEIQNLFSYSDVQSSELGSGRTVHHISFSLDGRNEIRRQRCQSLPHHQTQIVYQQAVTVVSWSCRPCSTSFPVPGIATVVWARSEVWSLQNVRTPALLNNSNSNEMADSLTDRVKIAETATATVLQPTPKCWDTDRCGS